MLIYTKQPPSLGVHNGLIRCIVTLWELINAIWIRRACSDGWVPNFTAWRRIGATQCWDDKKWGRTPVLRVVERAVSLWDCLKADHGKRAWIMALALEWVKETLPEGHLPASPRQIDYNITHPCPLQSIQRGQSFASTTRWFWEHKQFG